MDLKGVVALVTGGNGGLGPRCAGRLLFGVTEYPPPPHVMVA